MRITIQKIVFFLLATTALSCKPREAVVGHDKLPPQSVSNTCTGIVKVGNAESEDPLLAVSLTLEGDCLSLMCSGGGGCKPPDLELLWSGQWAESIPPVTHLYISHNAKGDTCESIWKQELRYDLHSLRYDGLEAVAFVIHAPGQPLQHLSYSYKAN